MNASLGTPAQNIRLHLDTGSSDLWVNTPGSVLCKSTRDICNAAGTYTANSSSTYKYLESRFNISYVDGSGASGDYVTDTFRFEGIEIATFQFGIGYVSSSRQGILGIGYPENEIQAVHQKQKPYQNLPARLVADGHIATSAYSIWLDDVDSATGSVLFGGVDRSQYHGNLVTVPVQKVGSIYREFFITMTGLDVGSKQVTNDMALAVLLDTGSSLTYLPTELAKSIYEEVNATWVEQSQLAIVPCALGQRNDSITFHFSEPASISVAMKELILSISSANGELVRFADGSQACLFGIFPAGSGITVLGDTFLRSAYVVYDTQNNEVSLAQSNFGAMPDIPEVTEIGTGKSSLPDATAAPRPVPAQSGLPAQNRADSVPPSTAYFLTVAFITLFF